MVLPPIPCFRRSGRGHWTANRAKRYGAATYLHSEGAHTVRHLASNAAQTEHRQRLAEQLRAQELAPVVREHDQRLVISNNIRDSTKYQRKVAPHLLRRAWTSRGMLFCSVPN